MSCHTASQAIQETAHSASAADSPADESGMPGQESTKPGTQLQQDAITVEDPHHESSAVAALGSLSLRANSQGSKAHSMANSDSHPLQPQSSDAALASSKAPRAPKQGVRGTPRQPPKTPYRAAAQVMGHVTAVHTRTYAALRYPCRRSTAYRQR